MNSSHENAPENRSENLSPPRQRRWRSILHSCLLSMVLLVCGAGIGAGLTLVIVVRHAKYAIHHPEIFPSHAAARLRHLLDLSDQQTAQVESILRERQKAIQKIHQRVRPEFEAQLAGIEKDIAAVLKPDQAKEWRAWMEEKRRTWLPPAPLVQNATTQPASTNP
jgi:hypothetical protein